MHYSPAFLIWLLTAGIPADIFMAIQTAKIIMSGIVETKQGARPITRATRPLVYWGLTLWMLIGTIGVAYALSVAARMLLYGQPVGPHP